MVLITCGKVGNSLIINVLRAVNYLKTNLLEVNYYAYTLIFLLLLVIILFIHSINLFFMENTYNPIVSVFVDKKGQNHLHLLYEGNEILIPIDETNAWFVELQGTIKAIPCSSVFNQSVIY